MTVPLLSIPSFLLVLLGAGCVCPLSPAFAQSHSPRQSAAKPQTAANPPAEAELEKRISAAQAARATGDPAPIAQSNERLIAFALRDLGQLRLIQSAYPQAVELYRRSLTFEDIPDARVDLAIAELYASHPDDALTESQEVLAADPNNLRALNVSGQASMKKGDYAKAADALDRAARLNPDFDTLYSLGICLLQIKDANADKNKLRAAAVFQQMMQLTGDSGSLHVLFGRAYRDANDMPAAIREFKRAIALDPSTPHAHYFLALAIFATNEWHATPEIKSEFAKELQRYPKDYLANYILGFIASGERQYEVSDKYLETSVAVNPNWPEPWLYMGLNAYARGDMKRAETTFRKAVELTGSDEARSNYQIRRAYIDLGRILEALDAPRKAKPTWPRPAPCRIRCSSKASRMLQRWPWPEAPDPLRPLSPSIPRTKPKPPLLFRRTATHSRASMPR